MGTHAYGNLRNTDVLNVHTDRANNAAQLFLGGEFVFQELAEDQARFAAAADHSQKGEGPLDPFAQEQRVVLMTSGDDQSERRTRWQGFLEKVFPGTDSEASAFREILSIGQRGSVVKNSDFKIKLESKRRDCLRHMARPGNPERARR